MDARRRVRFCVSLVLAARLLLGCGGDEAEAPPVASPEPPASPPVADPAHSPGVEPADPPAATAPSTTAEPAPPAPTPAVAEIAIDGEGWPVVHPSLADATLLGAGPWCDDAETAVGAGWVRFANEEGVEIVTDLEHGRALLALVAGPSRIAPPSEEVPLSSIWLARLERRTAADDGLPEYRRVGALRLYDGAISSIPVEREGYRCEVESELRARDLDGDREVEVTVFAAYLQPTRERWQGGGTPDECGAVAFIVGLDDWNVQASLTREYGLEAMAASLEIAEHRSTVWQVRDADGDRHADLHVVERWRFLEDAMGDYIGDGESIEASRRSPTDRRDVDCPYVAARDAWQCDADPPPGQLLFGDPATRAASRGERPW